MNYDKTALKEKLKNLPLCPGVYIMKNREGNVIYVGKSKLLKNRVNQYFMHSKNHSPKTLAMVSNVYDFDYFVTDTEAEALVLECNLIKKYLPKYNILLKDDKQYPYIKITFNEDYPRIYMTRNLKKDGSRYFGPYMSSYMVKETLETIKHIFKVRSCKKNLPKEIGKGRPCLYHHINQCSAPCNGKITREEYNETFDQIAEILEGKFGRIIKYLTEKMYDSSEKLEFEQAARYRDKIESIKILGEKQKIISTNDNNRDIIGIYQDKKGSCIQVFYVRDGKVSGSEYFVFDMDDATKEELLSEFIKQHYFNATIIPKEILIPVDFDDSNEIQNWLSEKNGHKIYLTVPKRGEKLSMMSMVCRNAEESLQKHRSRRNSELLQQNDILVQLMSILDLPKPPFRIESYDISNISGAQSVGAYVVYKNAKEFKKGYRRFRIKTVEGSDDYESMREVIYRRIKHAYDEEDKIMNGTLKAENAKFLPLPDLILLDGGKGHVSAIKMLMETLGEDIPIYGLVKDDKHRTRGLTDENEEFAIDTKSDLFKFLSCVQEEVHRFALGGFHKEHEKTSLFSKLEEIVGVGPAKRQKLLKAFVTIDRIKKATIEELCAVVDKTTAKNIIKYFDGGNSSDNTR